MSYDTSECVEILGTAETPLFDRERYDAYKMLTDETGFYDDNLLRVMLFGRFKSGKSSLVNSLAGRTGDNKIAAVDALEKTAWIARYWPSDKTFCNVVFDSGMCKRLDIEEFIHNTEDDIWDMDYLKSISRIDVGYKNGLIHYAMIDTPGIGAIQQNENKALDALKDADLVLYVVDINKLGQQREKAIVDNIRSNGTPMICVANKFDGDAAHQIKSEEDAIQMVAEHTGFSTDDIYLMSAKLYDKGKPVAVKYMDKLLDRIKEAGSSNGEFREKARSAIMKRARSEERKLLVQARDELASISKAKDDFEKNYLYNIEIVKRELTGHVRDYVRATLYSGYKDAIINSLDLEYSLSASSGREVNFAQVIERTLPARYMDAYWIKLEQEVTRTVIGLSQDKLIEDGMKNTNLTEGIRAVETRSGVDPGMGYNTYPVYGNVRNDISSAGGIMGQYFKAAGLAAFSCSLLGLPLAGTLLPLALFGLFLSTNLKGNQNKANVSSMRDLLNVEINHFADVVALYSADCISKNLQGTLVKRLESIGADIEKRLPEGYSPSDTERVIESRIRAIDSGDDLNVGMKKPTGTVSHEYDNPVPKEEESLYDSLIEAQLIDFLNAHPEFSKLPSASQRAFNTGMRLKFEGERNGENRAKGIVVYMEEAAEGILQSAAGEKAKPFVAKDKESQTTVTNMIRICTEECQFDMPSYRFIEGIISSDDIDGNMDTLKKMGIQHFVVRSGLFDEYVPEEIRNTWKNKRIKGGEKTAKQFLKSLLDLYGYRNNVLHDVREEWREKPVESMIECLRIIINACRG